ncbi:MAG: hypothetical protein A2V77_13490 [Anaeromyxobacter sp. RBG_16_69_14]|nr:MAG: hypothetical protein A2V77_13490 [Anaeromyxobacter sp. RBG_16_69_14]
MARSTLLQRQRAWSASRLSPSGPRGGSPSNRHLTSRAKAARLALFITFAASISSRCAKPYGSSSIRASSHFAVSSGSAPAAWRASIQPAYRSWTNIPKLPLEPSSSSAFS